MQEQKHKTRRHFSHQLSIFLKNQNKRKLSEDIISHLSFIPWKKGSVIAIYYPLKDEPDLLPYMRQFPQYLFTAPSSKKVFKLINSNSTFSKAEEDFFYEPESQEICPIQNIDVFLVPCLGVDRKGHRLGRGQGYYDQVLSQAQSGSIFIGIVFDVQVLSKSFLPTQDHDQNLDGVVTPQWLLLFQSFFEKQKLNNNTQTHQQSRRIK